MGFSTPPGHRNPTYDENTDGFVDRTKGVNVPDFEEDPNSPFTFSSQTSFTATLARPSNFVLVYFRVSDEESSFQRTDLQVNAVTSADYDFIRENGTDSRGASKFRKIGLVPPDGTQRGAFLLLGDDTAVSLRFRGGIAVRGEVDAGLATGTVDVTSGPVTSFTIGLRGSISGTLEVFSRVVE